MGNEVERLLDEWSPDKVRILYDGSDATVWWRWDGKGYTRDMSEAGLYDAADFEPWRKEDKLVPVDPSRFAIDEIMQRLRDSAKPDPSTDARPGWVAVGVLKARAEELRRIARENSGHSDPWPFECAADELAAIADNAGDAEAVERAACATVQRMIEDRCVVEVARCDVDSLREGSDCPLYGSDDAVYVTKVHADNGEIVDGEVYSRDLYEAITQAPSFESAGKGGEGE